MTRTESRDIFVGRTAEGGRIYLNFAYTEIMPVIVSGHHIGYRKREADNAGQMVYRVREIVKPAPGWTLEELEEVANIWHTYHMEPTESVPEVVAEKVRNWVKRG